MVKIGWPTVTVSLSPEDFAALDKTSRDLKVDRSTLMRLLVRDGTERVKRGEVRLMFPEKTQ